MAGWRRARSRIDSMLRLYLLLLAAAASAWSATPRIVKIVNAASQVPPYLSSDEIAVGSLLTIWGSGFDRNPKVELSGSWGTVPLGVVQASATRIDARVPEKVRLGESRITIRAGNEQSLPVTVILVAAQFGIYSRNGAGWGPGQIDEILTSGARSRNSFSNPAAPGSRIVLIGTGLGGVTQPEVLVAGKPVPVIAARMAPANGAGADEITALLPGDVPKGCSVPVQVRGAGRLPSNVVTLSIRQAGTWCDAPQYMPLAGRDSGSIAVIAASRTVFHSASGEEAVSDEAGGMFQQISRDSDDLNPFLMLPPEGSCTARVQDAPEDSSLSTSLLRWIFGQGGQPVDAAPHVSFKNGQVLRSLGPVKNEPGVYFSWLNDPSGRESGGPSQEFTSIAPLQFEGSVRGAAPFRVTLPTPQPFHWDNPASEIDRGQGVEVRWHGLDPGRLVVIVAAFQDSFSNTRGAAICAAKGDPGSFHVPAEVLAAFPKAPANSSTIRALLTVTAWPAQAQAFTAPGLDRAAALSAYAESAQVSVR